MIARKKDTLQEFKSFKLVAQVKVRGNEIQCINFDETFNNLFIRLCLELHCLKMSKQKKFKF